MRSEPPCSPGSGRHGVPRVSAAMRSENEMQTAGRPPLGYQRPRLLRPPRSVNTEGRGGGDACEGQGPAEVARSPTWRAEMARGAGRRGPRPPSSTAAEGNASTRASRTWLGCSRGPASDRSNPRTAHGRPDRVTRGRRSHRSNRPPRPGLEGAPRSNRSRPLEPERSGEAWRPVRGPRRDGGTRRDRCAPGPRGGEQRAHTRGSRFDGSRALGS